jgi:arylsulfatase A-like enzyme
MNPHDICFWIPGIGGRMINRSMHFPGIDEADLPPLPPNQSEIFNYYHPEQPVTEWGEIEWRHYAYDYYRMVERVDADVGRILDALDERDDETLIVFTTDHGEGLGRHRRVQKWHPFDHSAKVPFILAGAGVRQRGDFDNSHLVNLLDLFPTICDVAGVEPPKETRGRSLMPLARGDYVDDWPESTYADFQVTGRMLRTARYKYVKYYERVPGRNNGRWYVDADGKAVTYDPVGIRNCRVHPKRMLFDMLEDPWETKNLAGDSAFADLLDDHDNLLYDQWERHLTHNMHHTVN